MGDVVNVLWTGGWDSTFRVLQLVLTYQRHVRPHYILNPYRRSSLHELRAMREINPRLAVRDRTASDRILPLQLVQDGALPRGSQRDQLMALRARGPLGKQYARLSAYAASIGGGLELCVHTDDLAEMFLRDHVRRVEDDAGGYWRLAEGTTGDLALFTPFRFPLLDMTKVRMKQAAAALGVLDLMAGTWFCHKPRGEQPCGACAPCTYTIREGMGERLPRRAHARYWIVRARRATGTMARRLRLR